MISAGFDQLYLDNIGESIVFHWVEHLRTFLQSRSENSDIRHDTDVADITSKIAAEIQLSEALEKSKISTQCPDIVTGDIIEDRKSVFQGHTATVKSVEDVKLVINKLYENKKIAQATHNMYAYRIFNQEKVIIR